VALWFFASDLHGSSGRYAALFDCIERQRPSAVLLGGDLLPGAREVLDAVDAGPAGFISGWLGPRLRALRARLGRDTPRLLLILGNDDPRIQEPPLMEGAAEGLWDYVHARRVEVDGFAVFGYAYVPPSPFLLKDWERYDVGRHVDPGCVSPEEGLRSVAVAPDESRYSTIHDDLEKLFGAHDLSQAVLLAHGPPYRTHLDRADIDGRFVDHVRVDPHVGSAALREFIESRQPRITLHGHIHESPRLTGDWRDRIGRTWCFSAAHDGPELALVRFDPAAPESATRTLIEA